MYVLSLWWLMTCQLGLYLAKVLFSDAHARVLWPFVYFGWLLVESQSTRAFTEVQKVVSIILFMWGLRFLIYACWRLSQDRHYPIAFRAPVDSMQLGSLRLMLTFFPLYGIFYGEAQGTDPWVWLGILVALFGLLVTLSSDVSLIVYKRAHPWGILKTGVRRWCRYPHYGGEIIFWLGIACVSGSGSRVHYGILAFLAGPVVTLLWLRCVRVPWMDEVLRARGAKTYLQETRALGFF